MASTLDEEDQEDAVAAWEAEQDALMNSMYPEGYDEDTDGQIIKD